MLTELYLHSGGLFTGAEEIKTDFDVERFGGTAGIAYDPNYHQAGDDINNLSYEGAYLTHWACLLSIEADSPPTSSLGLQH